MSSSRTFLGVLVTGGMFLAGTSTLLAFGEGAERGDRHIQKGQMEENNMGSVEWPSAPQAPPTTGVDEPLQKREIERNRSNK